MRRLLVIYDLAPDPYEFPNIWGKFSFLFDQCNVTSSSANFPSPRPAVAPPACPFSYSSTPLLHLLPPFCPLFQTKKVHRWFYEHDFRSWPFQGPKSPDLQGLPPSNGPCNGFSPMRGGGGVVIVFTSYRLPPPPPSIGANPLQGPLEGEGTENQDTLEINSDM